MFYNSYGNAVARSIWLVSKNVGKGGAYNFKWNTSKSQKSKPPTLLTAIIITTHLKISKTGNIDVILRQDIEIF